MRRNIFSVLLAGLFCVGGWWLGMRQVRPPSVASLQAGEYGPALEYLEKHLQVIAREKHPTGTPENRRVGNYILERISALGWKPEIQKGFVVRTEGKLAAFAENLMVRIPGTERREAVLVCAHYDSVPHSFGAGDDGAAVAAMLSTLEYVTAHRVKNDLLFLFSDAEEIGMFGAELFVQSHPWAKDVRFVLNFEARGSSGPVLLFETSADNRSAIARFAESPFAVHAYSWSYEAYRRMPNNTDFSMFKRLGVSGLNFGFIDTPNHYHTPLDSPASLDRGSLYHQAAHVLGTALLFGNTDLTQPADGNATYVSLLGKLFYYPDEWLVPILLTLFALHILLSYLAAKNGVWSWKRYFAEWLFLPGMLTLATGSVYALIQAAFHFQEKLAVFYVLPPNGSDFLNGMVLFCLGLFFCCLPLFGKKGSTPEAACFHRSLGIQVVFLLLLAGSIFWVPGASYLFFLPLFFLQLMSLAWLFFRNNTFLYPAILAILALPAFLIFVAGIYLFAVAMGLPFFPLVAALVILFFGSLFPLLAWIRERMSFLLPVACLLLGLVVFGMALVSIDFSEKDSYAHTLCLGVESDQACWISPDAYATAWHRQLFGDPIARNLQDGKRLFSLFGSHAMAVPAREAVPIPPPSVQIKKGQGTGGNERVWELEISGNGYAGSRYLRLWNEEKSFLEARIQDRSLTLDRDGKLSLFLFLPAEETVRLVLRSKSESPVLLHLSARSHLSLPETFPTLPPRPPQLMPISDMVIFHLPVELP